MTVATSHELAEAVTDPNNGYSALGWYDPRNGEIGDLAVGNNVILNNYYVQDIADKFGNPMTPVGATPATSIRNIATTRSSALQSATNTAPTMAPQNATDRLFMALGVGQLPEALSALRPSAGSELGSDREYFNEAIPARGTARNRTAKAPLAANPSSPMTARPSEARATMAGIDEATNSHTKGTARRVLAIRGAPSGFDQILEDAAHALTYQLATA